MSEPIPHEALTYARAALRFQMLWLMNKSMAECGATAQRTASRLNCPERKVRRMLAGKSEMTLRDIGEMFWAIDGITIEALFRPRVNPPSPDTGERV